jgi:hypothetical protein
VATAPALFPGSSTFPGTGVYPGQGLLPIPRLFVSLDDYQTVEPSWIDLSDRIRSYDSARGRNSELEQFSAGTLSVPLDNSDGFLRPDVTPNLTPMNKVRFSLEWDGAVYPVFTGYAESWQQDWPGNMDKQTTLRASDEFSVLALNQLPTTGTLASGDPIYRRINDVLDLVQSHAPRLPFGNLAELVDSEALTGQGPLDSIQLAIVSSVASSGTIKVPADFFAAADGSLFMLAPGYRALSPYDTPQAIFADDGSGHPYLDLQLDYSNAFLFNYVTVTGTSGTPQTASDSDSIARYGKRTRDLTVELPDAQALALASRLLDRYKAPFQRVTSLSPKMSDPDTCTATLGLELMSCIEVIRTPGDGNDAIDETLFVQSIKLSGQPGVPPACTLGVSPL